MKKEKKNQKRLYDAPDLLMGIYEVPQINKVWSMDDVKIEFGEDKGYIRVLHVLDLCSRKILGYLITTQDFNAAHVVRKCSYLLLSENIQEFDDESKRLIIHTDRHTHFTSKTWWDFFQRNAKRTRISMSPLSNAMSEPFNCNVRHMSIPLNEDVKESMKMLLPLKLKKLPEGEHTNKSYKIIIDEFIFYYNEKHKHSVRKNTPDSEPILGDSAVIAVQRNTSSLLEHRVEVSQYKEQLHKTYEKLMFLDQDKSKNEAEEFLVKKLETLIQTETRKLALLNHQQFISVNDDLKQIQETVNRLEKRFERRSKEHATLPLRDPIVYSIYEKILNLPFYSSQKQELIPFIQFRIATVILYITGSRINEIIDLTYQDIKNAKQTNRLATIQHKTKEPRMCVLGEHALAELDRIQDDFNFLFIEEKLKYLGATIQHPDKPMHRVAWTRSINKNLKRLSEYYKIPFLLKSHSFRVGFVTRLLKKTDIEKTANLIGHKTLTTTKRYNRYLLNTQENRELTDIAFAVD